LFFNYTIKLLSFRLQNYTFYRFAFRLWVKKWLHEATKRAQVTDYLLFIFFFVLKNIKHFILMKRPLVPDLLNFLMCGS